MGYNFSKRTALALATGAILVGGLAAGCNNTDTNTSSNGNSNNTAAINTKYFGQQ